MWHFHKIINTSNTPISNNNHLVYKLSFGIKSYHLVLIFALIW